MKLLNILLALLLATTPAFSQTGQLGIRGVNSIVPMKVNSPAKAGFIQAYAGSSIPQGWLACDGTAVSSATYPDLFANIGETWGDGGDGAGPLFNLPDLETANRYLRSAGGSLSVGDYQDDATASNLLGGTATGGTWSIGGTATATGSGHGHNYNVGGAGVDGWATNIGMNSQNLRVAALGSDGTHTHGISGTATRTGDSALNISSGDSETRPTTAVVKFIIKLWDNTVDASVYIPTTQMFNIGDTKQSILSEAQFQSIHGDDWVKMRGQTVTESKICTEYSICTLPNAEGRFLRDSVSDANLRVLADDTTAKNGLSNALSSVTGGSVTVSGNRDQLDHAHDITDDGHTHSIPLGITYTGSVAPASASTGTFTGYDSTTNSETGITVNSTGFTGTFSASGTPSGQQAAAQTITGDTETAPDHIVVNTFIKID